MQASAEESLLQHANNTFFAAVELSNQGEISEAIDKFASAIHLFELLKASGSTNVQEWCHVAIDEATAQSLHLQLNMLSVTPKPEEQPETQPALNTGAIFRVVCRLDLVSCFLLSRDRAEEIITDGSDEPINLYAEDEADPGLVSNGQRKAPQAFLQITPQIAYPLGPEVPCLQAKPGYFVFVLPDNRYYGIVFPEGYPEEALATFRNELAKFCVLCVEDEQHAFVQVRPNNGTDDSVRVVQLQDEEEPKGVLQNVAAGITTGAEYVTWGIRSTSNFLRSGIERTGSIISERVQKPNPNVHVPSAIQSSVGFIKDITPGFVYISGGAASALASLAGYIGSGIGAMIPKSGSTSGSKNGVVMVGAASVSAVVDIFSELTGVGKNLIEGTQQASVQVVTARYGEEAGTLTHNLLAITKDAYQVARNVKSIGVKALAKGSVKAAGKSFIKQTITAPPSATSSAVASLTNGLKNAAVTASSTLKQLPGPSTKQ